MNKRFIQPLLLMMGLALLYPCTVLGMGESASMVFATGTGNVQSAVVDSSQTYAYFGTNDTPGQLIKIKLDDFTLVSSITFGTALQSAAKGIIDPQNNFAYFVSTGFAYITKVNLTTFAETDVLQLPLAFDPIYSVLIDSAGAYGYFASGTAPALVAKVRLSDMTYLAALTLNAGEDYLTSAVLDAPNGIAYFGTGTSPGQVIKVNLPALTRTSAITLNTGEDYLYSAVISTTGGYAYFGTHTTPGNVVRVRISDFTRNSVLALSSGTLLTSALINSANNFAYFGTHETPGRVVRVRLSNFSQDVAATLTTGTNLISGIMDTGDRGFAYFGTETDPGSVIQVDLDDTRTGPPIILTPPQDQISNPGGTATFSVIPTGTSPFTYQWLVNTVAIPGATAASYTTPALTFADDGSIYQCVVTNALGSITTNGATLTVMPVIKVFPNPWRTDRHTPPISFQGVAPNTTIKIFTLSLHWVKTVTGTDPITWDLTNDAGQRVASGYYFFVAKTTNDRQTVTGKLAIIK